MPRWSLRRPECDELSDVLERLGSITAVSRHYKVTFTTARKWILACGLESVLSDKGHQARLRQMVEAAPKKARRERIDKELDRSLGDIGDRKLMARAIVDEFTMRYIFKRCYTWERYVLKLTLVMYDFPPVEEIAKLAGVPWRMGFRKAKNGVEVPIWLVHIEGYRALRVLELTRAYMTGQKAFQADIALRNGPISPNRVHLGKDIYKANLLSSFGVKAPVFRGKGAGT